MATRADYSLGELAMSSLPMIPTGALMLVDSAPGQGEGLLGGAIKLATTPRKVHIEKWAWTIDDPMKRSDFLTEFRRAHYAHIEVIVNGGLLVRDNRSAIKTVGATWPCVVRRDLLAFKGCRVWIIMPRHYSFTAADRLAKEACERAEEKEPYSLSTIVAHLLDYVLNHLVYTFTLHKVWPDWRAFSSLPFFKTGVCSWFVADLYRRHFGLVFDRKPRSVTPADIQRFVWEDLYDETSEPQWDSIFKGIIE